MTFIVTIDLLLDDMGSTIGLSQETKKRMEAIFVDLKESKILSSWSENMLEKSDYYRFVTLMMTQKSREEEIWLDYMKQFLA